MIRALAFMASFISLISLSISSRKCIMKSISLYLYIDSTWKFVTKKEMSYLGSVGFLLSMTKLSALIIMNLVNLCANILSISSDCFIATEIRTELILVSIKTRSLSLRLMIIGFNNSSLLLRTSISGLLCLSTTCELKFMRQMEASNVRRTAVKYGLSDCDIIVKDIIVIGA